MIEDAVIWAKIYHFPVMVFAAGICIVAMHGLGKR